MQLKVTHHGEARGASRESQDAWRVEQRGDVWVAALADGVGGCLAGGVAAHKAVGMMVDYLHSRPQAWAPRRALAEFTHLINDWIYQEAMGLHGSPEMLSTLSVVLFEGGRLHGINVGDSPVFLWRQGVLRRLSKAHVHAEPGMEHVLSQAIGMSGDVSPWHFEEPLQEGDLILLASDGIKKTVNEARLEDLLSKRVSARVLVQEAREAWEHKPELADDISAVVVEVSSPGLALSEGIRSLEVIPHLQAGDRQDQYVLERPLNASMRVWLSKDSAGGRHVLKFPPLEAAEDERIREAYLREIWHAVRLSGPGFVHAREPAEGSLRYYVIEYIDAPNLKEFRKKGRLSVEAVIELARFLLECAAWLLERDRVHGDIKPENVLVLQSSEVGPVSFRMIDYGSATALFSTRSRAGTPSYLAPERFDGIPISERTEIYSIGATLYEALTGRLPHGEVEPFQTPSFFRQPKAPSRWNSAIPAWLDAVVLRAVCVDPAERQQAYSEMLYELANPGSVKPLHRSGASLLERNPLLFYKVLSAVLFVLVIVLGSLLLRRA